MENVISKRYVASLTGIYNSSELENIYNICANFSKAYNSSEKFFNIINMPSISKDVKLKFLLDSLDIKDKKQINFFRVIVENNRANLLPSIALELEKMINKSKNVYKAVLVSNDVVSNDLLNEVQQKLEKRLNTKLSIVNEIDKSMDGIKVSILDLGVEVSFYKNRFINSLQEYILKVM